MTEANLCTRCNGAQWIEEIVDGEIEATRCRCLKLKMMLDWLGPELARAKHRKSELFLPELDPETSQIIGDRTQDDLFIKGVWSEAAQHLRWALSGKKALEPAFSFKMVNDEKLLRVYLGHFSYSNRSKKLRDDVETYNNLSDLISGHSLLIIRLGKLGWKNVAAGGVLQEALNIRASEAKPTWLIEGERYFGDGHLFYNNDVGQYIEQNFDIVNVGGDVRAAQELRAALEQIDSETVAMGADVETPERIPESQERFVAEPESLSDRGRKYWKQKQKKRRWGSGNNSGGGLSDIDL